MISLRSLAKSFRGRPAVYPLSLEVPTGAVFGLLGHNGAGKSTTFGMLLGQVHPDAGEAFIHGHSVQRERAAALAQVGAIFEAPVFYDYLTGWQNLEIFTRYTQLVPRAQLAEAVEAVGLSARIHHRVRTYSHGMRQRLGLAQALLPAPRVLLLDEPTEGLDPEGIHEMRHFVLRLNRERGLTVLFSSHLLAEVQLMCEQVAVMHQGHLLFAGPWRELQGGGERFRLQVGDWPRALPLLAGLGITAPEQEEILLPPGVESWQVAQTLVQGGVALHALEPVQDDLENIYLRLVQAKRAEGAPVAA